MDINLHALEGLEVAGDSISIPDQQFKTLVDTAFNDLLQSKASTSLSGVEAGLLKQSYYGLSTVILEGARRNCDESTLSSLLEECKWTPDRIDYFNKTYQHHKTDLQISLARLDSQHPHIVDVDWRLDYCIKSNQLEKINQSSYLISLKTQEPDKDNSSLEFSCSVEQLQDLVSKLKDATKCLEKASQG